MLSSRPLSSYFARILLYFSWSITSPHPIRQLCRRPFGRPPQQKSTRSLTAQTTTLVTSADAQSNSPTYSFPRQQGICWTLIQIALDRRTHTTLLYNAATVIYFEPSSLSSSSYKA